ncbi:outer membrane beta-barrel protein [Pseudoduganella lutea]|uniref:outer membrane beta-barrel protein n=1 Tax=Pseudoduganella lutea TaxID=321985 RepID=UPI0013EE44FC|nr:outer membrane beta-barrel protein [Pseudoduganella lutea]
MFTKYLAAAALSLAASIACAGPAGVYAGVSAGATRFEELDGNKSHFGAFVGYGFNPAIALELGYRQHGEWNYFGTDVKLKETQFSAVGSMALSRNLDLFARVGYGYGEIEADRAGYRGEGNVDSAIYGIGLGYQFVPNLSSRVELQKPASDITSVTASLVWKF